MTAAIKIIKDEHLAIASVLYGLQAAIRRIGEGSAPDMRLLDALLRYVEQFPERLHHPKESGTLFPAVVARCAEAQVLVDVLDAEHALGASLIEALRAMFARFSNGDSLAFAPFATAVDEYADFHWRHMQREEDRLLPLAASHLTAEDWDRVNAAFRANDNPLDGIRPKDEAESLYRRILSLADHSARAAGVASPARSR
jgi:hemerythrin-like domain-containing protein